MIVGTEGYILTNHHVVEAADEIEIALNDGRQARARAVGNDPETDLAVLKVDLKNLPAITFGRLEQVSVGDVVLAIGNPFGVGQTVTMGIVSATGRSHLGINTFENFIQTDAAINPGNSGGALIDVGRQSDRHQHRDLLAQRHVDGHRLCHPGEHRASGHGSDHRHRLGDARLDRRGGAGHHARSWRSRSSSPTRTAC